MAYQPYETTNSRKFIQLLSALAILLSIWKIASFKTAVIVGLAVNSADLNEAREKLVNIRSDLR